MLLCQKATEKKEAAKPKIVLSDAETAPYFVHACAAVLIIAGFSHYSMMKLTAATGLELTPKAKENVARGSAWSRFLAWVAEF